MTRLASILEARKMTYTAVAEHARLQPRTVRQLATGETPIDNVAVGTVRRIASALSVPLADLLEPDLPFPGDGSVSRGARLSAAIRQVMWTSAPAPGSSAPAPYPSPVERDDPDEIAALAGDDFFADMPVIDARRG